MITDEEAKKASEVLKEYCVTHEFCDNCPFYKGAYCELSAPQGWQL